VTASSPSAPPAAHPPAPPLHPTDTTGHEQVVFCSDRASGLRAIIALHNTALGPGLGGTRFYPYDSEDEALADVLRLSRGMSYKNAMDGIPHGGGKAVIIGDPAAL
jgi:valine dehydrogenase (NAD+)